LVARRRLLDVLFLVKLDAAHFGRLNVNWRVVDDPLQWILQRRKGNPRPRNSGWRDRSFCTTRKGLLRCISEHCGEVDRAALAKLAAFP
jgi:hypothetical protein